MIDVGEFIDDFLQHGEYDPIKRRAYYLRTRNLLGRRAKKVDPDRQLRLEMQEMRLRRARAAVKKTSPTRRKQLEAKLDALQMRFDKAKRQIKNPFKTKTTVTSRTISSKIRDISRFGVGS